MILLRFLIDIAPPARKAEMKKRAKKKAAERMEAKATAGEKKKMEDKVTRLQFRNDIFRNL